MEVYEIIKQRRKELGLTADQVAAALGVSRATIYRYESKDIEKVPITVMVPLAKVLHCSPGYLMGWEDIKEDATAVKLDISHEEQQIIKAYRSAPEGIKESVCKLLDVRRQQEEISSA